MAYSTICKKPTTEVQQALQNKFKDMAVKIDHVNKNRNYDYHCRAVRELMSAHFWVFVVTSFYKVGCSRICFPGSYLIC